MDPAADESCRGRMAGAPESPGAAIHEALGEVKELKEYASQYVAAHVDRAKLSARKVVIFAALGVLGLVIAAAVLMTAASLFLIGLAQGIAALLGGRLWAGNLIVGGGLLLLLAIGAWIGLRMYFASSRKQTVKRYEERLREQRLAHGHDARERSAAEA